MVGYIAEVGRFRGSQQQHDVVVTQGDVADASRSVTVVRSGK